MPALERGQQQRQTLNSSGELPEQVSAFWPFPQKFIWTGYSGCTLLLIEAALTLSSACLHSDSTSSSGLWPPPGPKCTFLTPRFPHVLRACARSKGAKHTKASAWGHAPYQPVQEQSRISTPPLTHTHISIHTQTHAHTYTHRHLHTQT